MKLEGSLLIKYSCKEQDFMVLADHIFETSKIIQSTWRRNQRFGYVGLLIAIILFALCIFLTENPFDRPASAVGFALILVGLFMTLSKPLYRRRYRKFALKFCRESQKSGLHGETQTELLDDCIVTKGVSIQYSLKWSGIESVELLKDHLLISSGTDLTFIIPRSGISEGDFDAFSAELRSRFNQFKSLQAAKSS